MFSLFSKIFKKIRNFLDKAKGGFLCDTCMYDYPNACNNSDRPNATKCSEYKRRGS